jgi:hypothetical protein
MTDVLTRKKSIRESHEEKNSNHQEEEREDEGDKAMIQDRSETPSVGIKHPSEKSL